MAKTNPYVKPLRFLEHEVQINYWVPYRNRRGTGTYGTQYLLYNKISSLPRIPSRLLSNPHQQFEVYVPAVNKTLVYILVKSELISDELHGPFLK